MRWVELPILFRPVRLNFPLGIQGTVLSFRMGSCLQALLDHPGKVSLPVSIPMSLSTFNMKKASQTLQRTGGREQAGEQMIPLLERPR